MSDSESSTPKTKTPLWEVRHDNKIYRISSHDLLLTLKDEGKLTDSHMLRKYGDTEWHTSESINWASIEAMARANSTSTKPTVKATVQSVAPTIDWIKQPGASRSEIEQPVSDLTVPVDVVPSGETIPSAETASTHHKDSHNDLQQTVKSSRKSTPQAFGAHADSHAPDQTKEASAGEATWWKDDGSESQARASAKLRKIRNLSWMAVLTASAVVVVAILLTGRLNPRASVALQTDSKGNGATTGDGAEKFNVNATETTSIAGASQPTEGVTPLTSAPSETSTAAGMVAVADVSPRPGLPDVPTQAPNNLLAANATASPTVAPDTTNGAIGSAKDNPAISTVTAGVDPNAVSNTGSSMKPASVPADAPVTAATNTPVGIASNLNDARQVAEAPNGNAIVATDQVKTTPTTDSKVADAPNVANKSPGPEVTSPEATGTKEILSLLESHRGTCTEIRSWRAEVADAEKLLHMATQKMQVANAQLASLTSMYAQTVLEVASLREQLRLINNSANSSSSRTDTSRGAQLASQQTTAQLTNAERTRVNTERMVQETRILLANAQAEYNFQTQRINQARLNLQGIVRKEMSALESSLEHLDFFSEKATSTHEKIYAATNDSMNSDPDILFAYILNSDAALQTGHLSDVSKNFRNFGLQLQTISPMEAELRGASIRRLRAIALAQVGVAQMKQDDDDAALRSLDEAVKADPNLVELRLLRGVLGTRVRGLANGKTHLLKAMQLNPGSPKVYRISLDTLLATKAPPETLLTSWLATLEDRADQFDSRAWLTATATAIALGDKARAQKFLNRIEDGSTFAAQKQQLAAKVDKLP